MYYFITLQPQLKTWLVPQAGKLSADKNQITKQCKIKDSINSTIGYAMPKMNLTPGIYIKWHCLFACSHMPEHWTNMSAAYATAISWEQGISSLAAISLTQRQYTHTGLVWSTASDWLSSSIPINVSWP